MPSTSVKTGFQAFFEAWGFTLLVRGVGLMMPVVATLMWNAGASYFERLDVKIEGLKVQSNELKQDFGILSLRENTVDASLRMIQGALYTSADAGRDLSLQTQKNIEQDRRVEQVETRILRLEDRVNAP